MGVSISIEVQVPDTVDRALVTAIGERCSPYLPDDEEPMTVGEAIQWAIGDAGGMRELASLGVTWTTIETK